ncbi:MAG: hypothetical protein HQL27_09735 [Candidatus Omnitrophica bacterium]|nr:hypothetical protein [Candidatus Omnitrophota bacterium]
MNIGIILLILLVSQSALAETITLKSGKVINGKIVKKSEDEIKVDMGVGVDITYSLDDIKSIDGKEISPVMSTDDAEQKKVFGQRLEDVMAVVLDQDKSRLDQEHNLETYSREFPNSDFADDADFIMGMMAFTGATLSGKFEFAENMIFPRKSGHKEELELV